MIFAFLVVGCAVYFDLFDPRLSMKVRKYGDAYFAVDEGQRQMKNYFRLVSESKSQTHANGVVGFAFKTGQPISFVRSSMM